MKSVILLQSLQNDSWVSLEETKKSIEHFWKEYCSLSQLNLVIINIDHKNPKSELKELLNAQLIVVGSFNKSMAEWLYQIRVGFNIDCPLAIYSYHLASVALAPLYHFKILENLTNKDFIIVNCEGDVKILEHALPNLKCIKIPFHLYPTKPQSKLSGEEKTFIYIGRISEQKNLHTLLWSFSKLNDSNCKMLIYGDEDHLGSPNMGKASSDYLNGLKDLSVKLKIENRVQFLGFIPREEIENRHLNSNYIFISASLHADENFGLAAYRSLLQGKRAVLSSFGGHIEFQSFFPHSIFYTPVYHSENGPYIDSYELKKAMETALNFESTQIKINTTEELGHYFTQINSILGQELKIEKIIITSFAQQLFQQQEFFLAEQKRLFLENKLELNARVRGHQLFKDFTDPLSHQLFLFYGAMERVSVLPSRFELAPWVNESHNAYVIEDFHKGRVEIPKNQSSLEKLYSRGYLAKIEE